MYHEDHRTEYKIRLTDQLEKEVVGFLNAREGGVIYLGISDDGQVAGVDDIDVVQRKVIDRIRNNIIPSSMGLFEVTTERHDERSIIKIVILSGSEKPYYIRSKGMSPEGAYIRIGSSTQKIHHLSIELLLSKGGVFCPKTPEITLYTAPLSILMIRLQLISRSDFV